MARTIATNTPVDRDELLEFLRPRHRMVLLTPRADGGWQGSPVTAGVDGQGRVVVSTYPDRAKARNVARHGRASVVVVSDDWNGPWVQVDGDAERQRMPAPSRTRRPTPKARDMPKRRRDVVQQSGLPNPRLPLHEDGAPAGTGGSNQTVQHLALAAPSAQPERRTRWTHENTTAPMEPSSTVLLHGQPSNPVGID